jgi:hypothetical protein
LNFDGNFSSSFLTNITFTNIASLYGDTRGGAVYVQTYNHSIITIDYCIFGQCKASYGGALALHDNTPYININHTRFENNIAVSRGADIYAFNSSCFNNAVNVARPIHSSVCSTTPPLDRLNCNGSNNTDQLRTCSDEVV